MFLDIVNGTTLGFPWISSISEGEKSPSGPISMIKDLASLKTSFFKLFLEFTSANNSFVELSKLFRKSLSFIT